MDCPRFNRMELVLIDERRNRLAVSSNTWGLCASGQIPAGLKLKTQTQTQTFTVYDRGGLKPPP